MLTGEINITDNLERAEKQKSVILDPRLLEYYDRLALQS